MIKSLILEISDKEGLYAYSAKELLKSPSYTDEKGLEILREIYEQSTQGVMSSIKIYGEDLLKKIDEYLHPSNIEVIQLKKTKTIKVTRTIYGTPSPGSLGDYWLLIDEYKRMDPNWINEHPEQWRRVVFNDQFMTYMQDQFGELHCEYCGKPNLKIFKWHEKSNNKIMCTTDHFYPKSEYPHLKEEPSNLIISCFKCNNDKGNKIYDENQISYMYDDLIRSKFVFDESKLSLKEFIKPKHG